MTDSLDLDALLELVPTPDEQARARTRDRFTQLAAPAGSLGRVEELAIWLAGVQGVCPPRPLRRPRAVLFAGDHGVAKLGVSTWPAGATAALVRATAAGGGTASTLARLSGTGVRVVDSAVDDDLDDLPEAFRRYKVRRGSGRIDVADACSVAQGWRAFRSGMAVADAEVDAGADLLVAGHLGVAGTTPAAVVIGALTHHDAAAVIGRGSGIDDAAWIRKCAAIRDALRRARPHLDEPIPLLAAVGGADLAAMTGFLVQAAVRRTPVLLDGVVSAACGLVAQRITYRAAEWWLAGHLGPEPAQALALRRLSLDPLLEHRVHLDDGSGALLAVPLLQAAAVVLSEASTRRACGLPGPAAESGEPTSLTPAGGAATADPA